MAASDNVSIDRPTLEPIVAAWGRVLIGTFVALILYGLTLAQAATYFRSYPGDRLFLKCLVSATVLLETLHMALSCHLCYAYMISAIRNPEMLLKVVVTLEPVAAVTGALIVLSQSFFAHRAWMLGEKFRPWVVLALLLLLGEFGFCVAYTVLSGVDVTLAAALNISWVIATASSCAVASDWIITTVLIITLHKSRTGIKRTDSVLDTLILYAVTTGFFTSIVMFLVAIFAIVNPSKLTFITMSVIVMKLYANSLLAALNSRQSLKDKMNATVCLTVSDMVFGATRPSERRPPSSQPVAVELRELPTHLDGIEALEAKERVDQLDSESHKQRRCGMRRT